MNTVLKFVILFCSVSIVRLEAQENYKLELLSRHKRIVGGENVEEAKLYLFLVTLNIYNSDNTFETCGAILIKPEWVLTAAHCIDNNPSYVYVTLEDPGKTIKADTFFIHEDWRKDTYENDIGLIKLQERVNLIEYIKNGIIKMASDTKITYEGQNGIILGYGITESGKEPAELKQVNVTIMSNEACRATSSEYAKIIRDSHICTDGTGGKGSCSGDSGGPLIVGNILVGLVSFTSSNCTSGHPSMFTRVSSYSQWINEKIFNNSSREIEHLILLLIIIFVLVALVIQIIKF